MLTYAPEITVTTRVAKLVKDASERAQINLEEPLDALDWFIEEARKLAVSIARAEYAEKKKEEGDTSKESIDSEVTA